MKRRAVIVGVDGFEGWDFLPLKYAVDDAIRMNTLLHLFGDRAPFDQIHLLRNPSDHEVRQTVARVIRGDKSAPPLARNDLFLFYFAGHGKRQPGGKYLLLCPQAERSVLLNTDDTNGTITDTYLKGVAAKGPFDCLFIFDACRNALLPQDAARRDGEVFRVMDGEERLRDLTASKKNGGGGICVTVYSCRDQAQASEVPKMKAGLFTYAFEEIIRHRLREGRAVRIDNDLILNELAGRMRDCTPDGQAQTPGIYCEGGDGVLLAPEIEAAPERKKSNKPKTPETKPPVEVGPPPPLVMTGHLQVNVNVRRAVVEVEGRHAGEASPGQPLNIRDLPLGPVSVSVSAHGYTTSHRSVAIQCGSWIREVFVLAPNARACAEMVNHIGGGATNYPSIVISSVEDSDTVLSPDAYVIQGTRFLRKSARFLSNILGALAEEFLPLRRIDADKVRILSVAAILFFCAIVSILTLLKTGSDWEASSRRDFCFVFPIAILAVAVLTRSMVLPVVCSITICVFITIGIMRTYGDPLSAMGFLLVVAPVYVLIALIVSGMIADWRRW